MKSNLFRLKYNDIHFQIVYMINQNENENY